MANVDIVYNWFSCVGLLGIDSSGALWCWEMDAWMRVKAAPVEAITPALAALARIAETLGSVTWRGDNRPGDPDGEEGLIFYAHAAPLAAVPLVVPSNGDPAEDWPIRWISLAEAREIWPDQQKPQGARPEAGREEAEEPGVGESLAGDPGVESPAPLAESLEE